MARLKPRPFKAKADTYGMTNKKGEDNTVGWYAVCPEKRFPVPLLTMNCEQRWSKMTTSGFLLGLAVGFHDLGEDLAAWADPLFG